MPGVARALAHWPGQVLGLYQLEHIDTVAIEGLSDWRGKELTLLGFDSIEPDTATALGYQGRVLRLGVTSIDLPAAQALLPEPGSGTLFVENVARLPSDVATYLECRGSTEPA